MTRLPFLACVALALGLLVPDPADARGRGGGGRGGFCNYCGCKGGPGYRAPDGKCVGKRNITKVCGAPPTSRCRHEGRSERRDERNPTSPRVPNPFG